MRTLPSRLQWPAATVLALLAAGAILSGSSATALMALGVGAAAILAARYWPTGTYWAVASAWTVAVLFALPLALFLFRAEVHKAPWLFDSARDRIAIWGFTAERAIEHPILGIGTRSTRVLVNREKKNKPEATEPSQYVPPVVVLGALNAPPRFGHHAHNNFLQIWLELGAVGAALVLAVGLGLLQLIRHMRCDIRPYAFGAFTSACIIASFGFGLWQAWLLCGYALSIILINLARAIAEPRTDLS